MGGIEHALSEGFQTMKALQNRVVGSACMPSGWHGVHLVPTGARYMPLSGWASKLWHVKNN